MEYPSSSENLGPENPLPPLETLDAENAPSPPPSETLESQYPPPSLENLDHMPPPLPSETQDPPSCSDTLTDQGHQPATPPELPEEETRSRRRRRSRWDPPSEADQNGDASGGGGRKRKSRWADDEPKPVIPLPDFMKDLAEVQALNIRYMEISRRLQSGILDDLPEGGRSPSPEPIYDKMGIRINTRDYRARERLIKERQDIISQLIRRNPAFRPPSDYRPPKLQKKLYVPMKEYPGYNFMGLIIGPRGNTHQRMEEETCAKIVIRGKGSVKEGRLQQKRGLKLDPSENEDLHVLVEADTQEALYAAAGMVEKLLIPVDEGLNEHKRQQLRELAALNGTIRDDEFCRLCGEPGHRKFACPARSSTFKSDVLCKICGDGGHPTIDCPLKGTGKKMDDEYQNFLAELGCSIPDSLTKQGSSLLIQGPGSSGSNSLASVGGTAQKEYDETNLYIGHLPPTLDDDGLIRLFSLFGDIVMTKVIKDRVTGMSKGYGFVKYSNVDQASQAIASMHGYHLEGKIIAVRVAGKPPQPSVPPGPPASAAPTHTGSEASPMGGGYLSQQYTAGGPLSNVPPPGGYMGVPPPCAYAPYAPPPPGSSMYTPVQSHYSMPPYGVHYPPSHHTLPPPNVQSTFPPSSFGHQSYYYAAIPPVPYPNMDALKSVGSAPWASNPQNPPASQPVSSSAEQSRTYGADTEYEKKFMAEIK